MQEGEGAQNQLHRLRRLPGRASPSSALGGHTDHPHSRSARGAPHRDFLVGALQILLGRPQLQLGLVQLRVDHLQLPASGGGEPRAATCSAPPAAAQAAQGRPGPRSVGAPGETLALWAGPWSSEALLGCPYVLRPWMHQAQESSGCADRIGFQEPLLRAWCGPPKAAHLGPVPSRQLRAGAGGSRGA